MNGLRLFGSHCIAFNRRTQRGERRFSLSSLAPAVNCNGVRALANALRISRARRDSAIRLAQSAKATFNKRQGWGVGYMRLLGRILWIFRLVPFISLTAITFNPKIFDNGRMETHTQYI